ncbi:hypothetical protein Z043_123844 [Scleropages formosus]|uniref:Small G protein signalling modulator 1/2 Rab-binding domain-containing protein n=1 Tax=Scleropages formosus TaxID=113540 RepID=A0A0N8JVJ8_SCLFO|nr:hypothetical protein Z043_123844 [Scleropages formosus]
MLVLQLVFEKEGVYLHTNAKRANQDTTIPGFIRIVERGGEPALEWSPLEEARGRAPAVFYTKKDGDGGEEETNFDPGYEPDWAVISTVKKTREHPPVRETGQWGPFSLPLSELHSLRRARFSLGRNFLVLTSRGGHPLPPLHFHRGGTMELLRALQRYIILAPALPCTPSSPVDGRLFLAYPHDSGALSQSFDELQLFDDGSSDLVSVSPASGTCVCVSLFVVCVCISVCVCMCVTDTSLSLSLSLSLSVQRFIQDPYATTLGGFSKVTNFFRGALRPPESPLRSHPPLDTHGTPLADDEPGFELITCVRAAVLQCALVASVDKVAVTMCVLQGAELGPRPQVSRGPPLGQWEEFLDTDGRVRDPHKVKEMIFRGVRLSFTCVCMCACARARARVCVAQQLSS